MEIVKLLESKEDLEDFISINTMALIYFGSEGCGVCRALKPKVEEMLESFPRIAKGQVDIEKSVELSAASSIFTIPAILVYVEAKEVLREARHISIREMKDKIQRYYNMLF